ncbi:MAG: transporter permease [Devosia sp.]|jgi:ABC-type nitrate/sulfonate/bicarbonate transport system permease component|nr:transporter permease [Devosia sp.]
MSLQQPTADPSDLQRGAPRALSGKVADFSGSKARPDQILSLPRLKLPVILVAQVVVLAVVLFAVQHAVDSGAVKTIYLASPTQVLAAFPKLVEEQNLFYHLYVTLSEAAVGVLIGGVLGVATGIYMGLFPRVNQFLNPFLVWAMAVPKVTIIPLLTLYLGIGYGHKVFIIFLFSYFMFVFNTIAGIRQVQENHVKVAKTLGASHRQIVWKVILPSAIPSIMAAVRIEAATCLVAALFAEMVASKAGLGNLLNKLTGIYDTAGTFALVILITTISLIIIFLVEWLEKRVLLKWKYA